MHLHDRAGTLAGLSIIKPSVRLTVTPVSQQCQHRSKPDLLEMKAESSGTTKYIFASLQVRIFIDSVYNALV